MIDKKCLEDYSSALGYLQDLERKENRIKTEIENLENRIREIEAGEMVVDKVKGGEGGIQNYRIEGLPTTEYTEKKNRLYMKRLAYEDIKNAIDDQKDSMLMLTRDVEVFIVGIDDVLMKRIVNLRFIEKMTWNEVADVIGGNNSEDSVRMAFNRFIDSI